MAKPKNPLLSLGAKGTIADTLTFQKRGREHIVREKPIPTDPYSLAQAYQRWDYRDYAYLWTLLSNADKQIYRTKASKYHITGFSLWMREHLKTLPDIVGRWHLDEKAGALAHDSSRNSNNGVIFGASPVSGLIDGAYYFDGINDYIDCGNHHSFNLTGKLFIEFFIKIIGTLATTWSNHLGKPSSYTISTNFKDKTRLRSFLTGVTPPDLTTPAATLINNQWAHVALTYDKDAGANNYLIYVNGVIKASATATGDIAITLNNFYIGEAAGHDDTIELDEASVRNRVLDITEILRHSGRRYPS